MIQQNKCLPGKIGKACPFFSGQSVILSHDAAEFSTVERMVCKSCGTVYVLSPSGAGHKGDIQMFAGRDAPVIEWGDLRIIDDHLRHLFVAGEMLAAQIASQHNLAFYLHLVEQARAHIASGDFGSWKAQVLPKLDTRL